MNAVLTLSQMLHEMDRALDDEIKEKSNSKQTKYIAQDGKLLSEEGGHYIYRFTLAEPADLQDDVPLSVVNDTAHPMRCIVVTSTGSTLTIACDKPLPAELLQCIELCDDSTELIKRLRSALKEVNEGEAQLGSKCFKLVPYRSAIDTTNVQFGKYQPRPRQKQAVQKSLGGEVSFIVGPPGTGKTDTLAAIALKHLQTGCSVLIAAQTNIAVDTAIMRLCDFCLSTNNKHFLANGQVVRYAPLKRPS
ncbi:AAA domain-containing protein [Dictyobacter formicarum]|uniref:DNA2/NAM7 helicase helicase domain-containing protein n=1 Tax=Dictyobacter formicarum TaxID=2778368 RepID=A0ABQ3VUF0_9CHLR|nr:AAA domain-containing protein [Dictyobacter formicarum]GHO89183.1 hypothetical protein KSZ_71890 [Dictyobacter formicarum]